MKGTPEPRRSVNWQNVLTIVAVVLVFVVVLVCAWSWASTEGTRPTRTPRPTRPTPTMCKCDYNRYDCWDLKGEAGQVCYEYCKSKGRGDVHSLDGDHDGDACE